MYYVRRIPALHVVVKGDGGVGDDGGVVVKGNGGSGDGGVSDDGGVN
ncbi:hypothetical protein Tco_0055077, partial [Tanacetum coccineum]